jgi:hypothetical protein
MNKLQDTFECGHGIVFAGRRYIVAEHTCYQEPTGISLNIRAVSYERCDPMIYAFDRPTPKPKRKPRKAKKKGKKR